MGFLLPVVVAGGMGLSPSGRCAWGFSFLVVVGWRVGGILSPSGRCAWGFSFLCHVAARCPGRRARQATRSTEIPRIVRKYTYYVGLGSNIQITVRLRSSTKPAIPIILVSVGNRGLDRGPSISVTIRGNALTPCYGWHHKGTARSLRRSLGSGRLQTCAAHRPGREGVACLGRTPGGWWSSSWPSLPSMRLAVGVTARGHPWPRTSGRARDPCCCASSRRWNSPERAGENAGLIRDVYAVWELPIALLLPPVYALLVPVFRLALDQWRVRRVPLHRRVFSARHGLSYGGASLAFHGAHRHSLESAVSLGAHHASVWVLAVAAAHVQWVVNRAL